jgi:hypothetical protein
MTALEKPKEAEMLRLAIKYTALGTLLMALIGSPGLSKAFAMGGGGGGGTGYGTAGNPLSYQESPSSYQYRLGTNALLTQKSQKTTRKHSF